MCMCMWGGWADLRRSRDTPPALCSSAARPDIESGLIGHKAQCPPHIGCWPQDARVAPPGLYLPRDFLLL